MKNAKVAKGMNRFRKEFLKIIYSKGVPKHLKNNYRKFHHKPMRRRSKFNKIFSEYEND